MNIEPIPAFDDNYFWLLSNDHKAIVVDPGDAQVVLDRLSQNGLTLDAVLVTHKHYDHIGGVGKLKAKTGCRVVAPVIDGVAVDMTVNDGDEVSLLGNKFAVLGVPGHTLEHVAYYSEGLKCCFVGDTLFSSGCGRMFEGTPKQFLASLKRLAELPDDTEIYCAHEYTLANLAFAQVVEPNSSEILAKLARMKKTRAENKPTLPTTIGDEKQTNPFLRTDKTQVIEAILAREGKKLLDEPAVFHALRSWKDSF